MAMADAFSPVNLFEAGGQEAKGEQARMASIVGALAIADLVKSSLGPKGMDKILQSMQDQGSHTAGQIQITNDGATILRSVHVDNAAAKARPRWREGGRTREGRGASHR